jgi:hypothetical protein
MEFIVPFGTRDEGGGVARVELNDGEAIWAVEIGC